MSELIFHSELNKFSIVGLENSLSPEEIQFLGGIKLKTKH